jgi:hypothetical protein
MRGITLYLEELVEERERVRRRRALYAVAAALLLVAALPQPPKPQTRIIVQRIPVRSGVVETLRFVEKPPVYRTIDRRESAAPLFTYRHFGELQGPGIATRHLCVTPQSVVVETSDHITVSNLGTDTLTIKRIDVNGIGIVIDARDCENRMLQSGDRCIIDVAALPQANARTTIAVHSDQGETERVELIAGRP